MIIRAFTKLIFVIFTSLNIQVIAQDTFIDHNSPDSTIQMQESSLQKIWQIDNQTSSSTNLIVSENKIYTTTDNGLVNCYFIDGQEKWAAEILGSIKNNSVKFKDLFLTATNEGDLYSINSNNGDVVQVIGVGENITTDLSLVDLAESPSQRKVVVFGSDKGNIFCYDIFSFELIWKTTLSEHPLVSNPMLVDEKIVFKNSIESLYCVNTKSGALIWKYDSDQKEETYNRSLILTNRRTIYSLRQDGEIIAIDLMLGKKLWSTKFMDVIPQITLSIDNNKLILLNTKGEIIFISVKDGKEISKIDLMKSDLFSFNITENEEYIFIGFSDGSLYSVDPINNIKLLISQTNIPITALNLISKDELIVKDINGKITFYKTK